MSSYIGIPFADNTNLFTGTVTTTGVGSTLDVTGFESALIQLSGSTFSGIIKFERSLDGVTWYDALVTELNSMSQKTQIDSLGIFSVRSEAQFLRYNVTNITGSVSIIIDGGTALVSPVDKISWAMDETNNSPLNVKLQAQNSGIKQDLSGAFILSDAPQPVTVNQVIGGVTIIDTQGYSTLQLTTNATFASTTGVQFSTDGVTFTSAPMMTGVGTFTTALVANANYTVPCLGRFARISATVAGQFTYNLRNIQAQFTEQNLTAINGTAVAPATAQLGINIVQLGGIAAVTGGLAGTLGVGGSTAVGVAPTSNPIIAGAIDPGGLGRRLFSDATGRLILNPFSLNVAVPSSLAGVVLTTTAGGNLAPVVNSGYNNQVALSVQDTLMYEGQNHVELLAQILQEMKIMNQQLYELPRILSGQLNGINTAGAMPMFTYGDEPTAMRNDGSLFDKQQ
jgi:hypothetical protein